MLTFDLGGQRWTLADVRNAVFKTVCGALLRRPGWFDSHPSPPNFSLMTAKMTATAANLHGRMRTVTTVRGRGLRGD